MPMASYNESLVLAVPLENLPEGVKEGDTLVAQAQQVVVKRVDEKTAQVDFNHQLAGKRLHFALEVVSITKT